MELNKKPLVSIIMPVHNVEPYLRPCLDSVVHQTLRNIEIICVNDASQDKSAQILDEYAQADARIKVITYETNKTASQARKDGVREAVGNYVMFIDSDDSYEPDACEQLVRLIEKYDVDILQFGTFVDAEETVDKKTIEFFERFAAPYTHYLRGRDVFEGCFKDRKYRFNLWNKIYKTELCKKAFSHVEDGPLPKAQDLYAFFLISWYAKSYYGVKNKFYHYNYGRGITGAARRTTLPELERHCTQSKVAQKCKAFLAEQDAWEQYADVWSRMNRDLIAECVAHWVNRVDDADGARGFDILMNSWDPDEIMLTLERDHAKKAEYIDQKAKGAESLRGATASEYAERLEIERLVDSADAQIPEGFKQVVPIVLATNDNYSVYAGVTIQSILEHASPENYYRIYILYDILEQYHIEALEGIESNQASVKCVDVANLLTKKEAALHERAHFTKEMYYRFLIPEIFSCYDRMIYLDCDLVTVTDVAEIMDADLGDNLIAAVRNIVSPLAAKIIRRDFELDPAHYINSGVLVINISQWQKEATVKTCFEALRSIPKEKLTYPDQDILNVVCDGRIVYLDPAWNFYWHMLYGSESFVAACKECADEVKNRFKILHYASNIKPWIYPQLPLSKYFWKYARRSCFYEEILIKNAPQLFGAGANPEKKPTAQKAVTAVSNHGPNAAGAEARIRTLEQQLKRANQEIWDIHHSWTYRIGRFITWIPRKVRGGLRCYHENGWSYTWNRILFHLRLKKEKESNLIAAIATRTVQPIKPAALPVQEIKRDYDYYSKLPPEEYGHELKWWFKNLTGNTLNLENPKTFNEKIQWMKLYDSTPIKTTLADKYLIRDWIKENIGEKHLIPLLGVWGAFDEINFEKLPNQFALKATHGSGWNVIVDDKSKFVKEAAKEKFDAWMKKNFAFAYGLELHYMNIPPRIIAEEYHPCQYEYQYWCFNGQPMFISAIHEPHGQNAKATYDLNWNELDFVTSLPKLETKLSSPPVLEEMNRIARKISAQFAFVRVDFLYDEKNLFLGEITFTPAGGVCKWSPAEYDQILGDKLTLPSKSAFPEKK